MLSLGFPMSLWRCRMSVQSVVHSILISVVSMPNGVLMEGTVQTGQAHTPQPHSVRRSYFFCFKRRGLKTGRPNFPDFSIIKTYIDEGQHIFLTGQLGEMPKKTSGSQTSAVKSNVRLPDGAKCPILPGR